MEPFLSLTVWSLVVLIGSYCIGCRIGRLNEKARCRKIVAGRICAGHWPKRDLVAMLEDPCDWCDRVTECLDSIEGDRT